MQPSNRRPFDICLPLGNVKFSVRVGVLCTRGDTLLTNTEPGIGFHYLPGGAVTTGEDSATAAAREWTEETGLPPGPLRLVGVVENFFGPPDRRQHEIGFYYHTPAPAELPDHPFTVQDNPGVTCHWLPLNATESTPVYPLVIRDLLAVPPGEIRHIINHEE
ncbi:NUDIX domain-containing protein [Deinococcus sp. 6YEL10]|nr:NUDIX domain-containing protein [Deinococcus sp. 6YEL10]MCD0162564.1 NUDIX domain-containing protein [Deinococcus sp. 6YEL10]